ncbi:cytochrome c oxidase subunit 3, partial [Nostoc sp. 'Peltigera membranacea cyanobiont' 213]
GNYNQTHFGTSATTLFWHFVDVVWVFLHSLLSEFTITEYFGLP